jgi:hypothetical protein
LHLLRPTFFSLLHGDRLEALLPHILALLQEPLAAAPVNSFATVHEFSDSLRGEVRESLARHLFGSKIFLGLRLRLFLADFCWVCNSLDRVLILPDISLLEICTKSAGAK